MQETLTQELALPQEKTDTAPPNATPQLNCKNCGNTFAEHFCNRCGQPHAHRITLHHVLHDLVHVFLHADKGIFAFVTRILFSPGVMAREYLAGKRKIFNPFQYLIFSVGLLLFLMNQAHFYDSLESYNAGNASKLPPYFQKGIEDFSFLVKNHSNLLTFISLPLFAFAGWLLFRKRGQNYAEQLTVMVFSIAQVNTWNSLVFLAFLAAHYTTFFSSIYISLFLNITCFTITYQQLYQISWFKAFRKGVGVFAIGGVVQLILISMCMIAYILMLKSHM